MKKIIIPTDFSPAALNATNYGIDMALAIHAGVVLAHVLYIPVTYTDIPPAVTVGELKQEMEEKMHEMKENLLHRTGHQLDITLEVRQGNFFNELQALCEIYKPYAVVMGSQGASAAEYTFFGSHSSNAMRNLKWPVIAIPPGVKFDSVKKIALACDFVNVVDKIPVDEIEKLVKDFNAQLYVVNTDKTQVHDPEMIFESGLLQAMLEGLHPKYQFITNKDIDEGILNFCEINNIDLLVVLPKRHSLLDKFIHKSHTKQLVLHSHVPVLALHE